MHRLALPFWLLAFFPSCNSSSSYQKAPFPSQAVEVTNPSVARVYVARKGQVAGTIRRIRVFDEREEIGSIGATEFLCWERAPGRSLVELEYEGPRVDGGNIDGLLDLTTEGGRVYYYGVSLRKSDKKPIPELMSKEEGQALIAERTPAPPE